MMHFKTVLLVGCAITFGNTLQLPKTFLRCPVSEETDDKPNECLKKAIQRAVIQLSASGDDQLGALDLDPLKINKIFIGRFESGHKGPVDLELDFTDNTLTGIRSSIINSVRGKTSNPDDFEIIIDGTTKKLELTGPYTIDGKVLILPIQGKGLSNMTLINLNTTLTLKGTSQMKKGREFLKITNSNVNMNPERIYMSFENLFNGDKRLGDNMNSVMNDNWEEIYKELKPSAEKAFSAIFEEYSRRILERVQYKDVFIVM